MWKIGKNIQMLYFNSLQSSSNNPTFWFIFTETVEFLLLGGETDCGAASGGLSL